MDRYLPKAPLKDRIREIARDARNSHATVEQGEREQGSGDPRPLAVPGWYLVMDPGGPFGEFARVIDARRHYVDVVKLVGVDPVPIFPGFDPLEPVIQNMTSGNFELVFGERAAFGSGILIGFNKQWTPRAISDVDPLISFIASVDVTSRPSRQLGHVTDDGPGLVDDVGLDFATRAPFYDGGAGVAIGIIGAFMRVTLWAVAPMLAFRTDVGGDSTMYLFDGSAPLEISPAPGSGRSIRAIAIAAPDWRGVGSPVRFRREL